MLSRYRGRTWLMYTGKLIFSQVTDHLPMHTFQLYRCRWEVELFFKWIKQHLRIKAFYGTTENAVKTQVWIAVSGVTIKSGVRTLLSG